MNNKTWIEKVEAYCIKYNIPLTYLAEIMNEPKVVPMIRGKAFEFSAMLQLQSVLSPTDWSIDKPVMNAQFGFHDMDVRVKHIATGKTIGVECKLAGKNNFKKLKDGSYQIRIKCMRSRTLGDAKVRELAPKIGVDFDLLKIHNDQYVPENFDVVMTTIGNAFYDTNAETDAFDWRPNAVAIAFLEKLFKTNNVEELQSLTFNQMYLAYSKDLAIAKVNNVVCSRGQCPNPTDCGFIPNYPIIYFDANGHLADNRWQSVEFVESLFTRILPQIS
jgi:hypothetical protein